MLPTQNKLNLNWVTNGLQGSSLMRLMETGMDPGALRPWRETDALGNWTGRSFVTLNVGVRENPETGIMEPIRQNFLTNTPALLQRQDWLRIDSKVNWAAKQRLRFWSDLYGANPYTIPNGIGVLGVQHTIATGDATSIISMDPIRQGPRSRPTLDIGLTPLPVISGDGSFTYRDVMVSRNSGIPLDLSNIALQARKNAESVENLAIGITQFSYNGGTTYGLTNHPSRTTKSMTLPTANGWAPTTTITEILAMIKTLKDNFYYGPYTLYYSNNWSPYFNNDYQQYYSGETLLTRIEKIEEISECRNLDFLTNYQIILVQMTDDVCEGVQGMDFTTVEWQEQGGMEICFKVMCIMVPRVKVDANGFVGINHGTAA